MNNDIPKKRGRPRIFSDEQHKQNKMRYMLNKEWYCEFCKPEKNYTLAGKSCHLETKKHQKMVAIL